MRLLQRCERAGAPLLAVLHEEPCENYSYRDAPCINHGNIVTEGLRRKCHGYNICQMSVEGVLVIQSWITQGAAMAWSSHTTAAMGGSLESRLHTTLSSTGPGK